MLDALESAKSTLVHYLQLASESEFSHASARHEEIGGLVEDIVNVAVSEALEKMPKPTVEPKQEIADVAITAINQIQLLLFSILCDDSLTHRQKNDRLKEIGRNCLAAKVQITCMSPRYQDDF
ncbi:hypothetical protein TUMEXPCC7403_16920 [Tumidithrix helvetica PCC 7403]|uniref:hypothetical protein n=1 Tax=Tumidithrix helvetica TaxID=3457545 RepID=UPI003CB9D022